MKRPSDSLSPILAGVLLGTSVWLLDCHCVLPFKTQTAKYNCGVDVVECVIKGPKDPSISVTQPPVTGDCYKTVSTFAVGDQAYCEPQWHVRAFTHDSLAHAYRIVTKLKGDNTSTAPVFLDVGVAKDAEGLYVAYDSRASQKPDWLQDYAPVNDPTGVQAIITVNGPGKGEVNLAVYKRRGPLTHVQIPGNLAGGASGWPAGLTAADAMMYMVLVVPKPDLDCTNAQKVAARTFQESCRAQQTEADDAAKLACEGYVRSTGFSKFACAPASCSTNLSCPEYEVVKKEFNLGMEPWTFQRSSEIEFDPSIRKSQAVFSLWGKMHTRDVKGGMHFEYRLDGMSRMTGVHVNSLSLKVDPFQTDQGTVSDFTIGLLTPFDATCATTPVPHLPCDMFVMPATSLLAASYGKVDGQPALVTSSNQNPAVITIDHKSRTLNFSGSLSSTEMVNGKPATLTVAVDISGHFKNFAPVAKTYESTRKVECSAGRAKSPSNSKPVYLDAAGSFEIYDDPLPASAFSWFENYGLLGEKPLGTGKKVTVPPHTFAWGVHKITLAVRDASGVTTHDSFLMEVRDSVPPEMQPPPDALALSSTGDPMQLDLEKPFAFDACETEVLVSNDAPPGNLFQPGITTVTWTADDTRGNISQATQDVYVFVPLNVDNPDECDAHLQERTAAFEKTAAELTAAASACRAQRNCAPRLGALSTAIKKTVSELRSAPAPASREVTRRRIAETLGKAAQSLNRSALLLAQAERNPARRASLRQSAISSLKASRTALGESFKLARTRSPE